MKKYGGALHVLGDHAQVPGHGLAQPALRGQLLAPQAVQRGVELAGRPVHDLDQQGFLARDVGVQTAALNAQFGGQVTHAGGVIAALGKQPSGHQINLLAAADRTVQNVGQLGVWW